VFTVIASLGVAAPVVIRKLTSRAPIASASAPASTSTAATGGTASTAASNAFKFNGDRRRSSISP
jgi:hypothetical protein